MKGRITTILAALFMLASGSVSAQLFVGPAINGGVVYGGNYIISDTSRYHIPAGSGLVFGGGLDILYGFNENIRAHIGVAYSYKQLNLDAPSGREGLTFTELENTTTYLSIPMTVHYRIPVLGGNGKYVNFIAGHRIDFMNGDSTVNRGVGITGDSTSYFRHEFEKLDRIIPTLLLGAGLDFEFSNGNIFNITAMWNIGTGAIFQGNIAEWELINESFDPETMDVPAEFPEHYFDFALKGSSIGLRASYWFNLQGLFDKDDDNETLIED